MEPDDALISTQEIVRKYRDFVDYAIPILQLQRINQEPSAMKLQRRIEMVEKLDQLVKDVTELMRHTFREMAWLKDSAADGVFVAEFALRDEFIPFVFRRLHNINSSLVASTSLLDELRNAERQLSLLMTIIAAVRQRESNPGN